MSRISLLLHEAVAGCDNCADDVATENNGEPLRSVNSSYFNILVVFHLKNFSPLIADPITNLQFH